MIHHLCINDSYLGIIALCYILLEIVFLLSSCAVRGQRSGSLAEQRPCSFFGVSGQGHSKRMMNGVLYQKDFAEDEKTSTRWFHLTLWIYLSWSDSTINKELMWHDIVKCLNVSSPSTDTVRQCPCYKAEGEPNWVQRRKKSLPLFQHQRMAEHSRAGTIE